MGQPSPPPSQLAAAGALLCLPLVLVLLGLVLLVVARLAAWTLLVFLPAQPQRWQLLAYWVATLAASLPIMRSAAARAGLPQIVLRKGYHLLAALLFIPVFFLDRQLMCVSLAIAFAALVGVEAARCLRVPLLGDWVHTFMVKFVDERDGGVVYVTHFTLLLGLAVPMWLALWVNHVAVTTSTSSTTTSSSSSSWTAHAATGDNSQGCVDSHGLSAPASCWGAVPPAAGAAQLQLLTVLVGLCGMVIIGVGDTMAAYCGKLYGSRAIHIGSRKTLEGTVAGAVSSMATWGLLLTAVGMAKGLSSSGWVQLGVVTAGASLLEACTTQLDNLMIPLWYLPQVLLIAAGK
jgi:dolichol kinase